MFVSLFSLRDCFILSVIFDFVIHQRKHLKMEQTKGRYTFMLQKYITIHRESDPAER